MDLKPCVFIICITLADVLVCTSWHYWPDFRESESAAYCLYIDSFSWAFCSSSIDFQLFWKAGGNRLFLSLRILNLLGILYQNYYIYLIGRVVRQEYWGIVVCWLCWQEWFSIVFWCSLFFWVCLLLCVLVFS